MEGESCVPPGFRFHPTEEELVGYYLKRKIDSLKIDLDVIVEVDLYRIEPWDIQDRCKLGYEEQSEWYFFSHKDRKHPTGRRTNRATTTGFWKATGRDKAVVSKESVIGMRKTLVFYKGRAPNGMKTDWIMHEYRLQSSEHGPPQEEGWVVCRAFKKPTPNQKQRYEPWINNGYYLQNNNNNNNNNNYRSPSFQEILNPMHSVLTTQGTNFYQVPFLNSSQQQIPHSSRFDFDDEPVDLPQLDSPTSLSASLEYPDHQENRKGLQIMDKLLMSKPVEPSLFSFPNMPLIPCDDEVDAQSQMNQFLEYFPDL